MRKPALFSKALVAALLFSPLAWAGDLEDAVPQRPAPSPSLQKRVKGEAKTAPAKPKRYDRHSSAAPEPLKHGDLEGPAPLGPAPVQKAAPRKPANSVQPKAEKARADKKAVEPVVVEQAEEPTLFSGWFGGGNKPKSKKKEQADASVFGSSQTKAKTSNAAAVSAARPALAAKPAQRVAAKAEEEKPMPSYAKTVAAARMAYEKGDYAQAAKQYESIPKTGAEYLRTREELAWAYLRGSDWQKLRGLMPHLNSKLVPMRWRLEGRVLSSMIYLKDCQYEKVREEMEEFQHELAPLTRTIDQKIAGGGGNSAYWRALKDETNEAIFKMKFVRMELRSRLVMLSRAQVIDIPSNREARERIGASMQTFPSNGDIWADEVFQMRGEGRSACAAHHQAKVVK